MCYMTSWSIKRPGAGKFTPENIDPMLCTHVLYAFGSLKDFKLTFTDEKDTEQYKEMMALREKNANLKVSVQTRSFSPRFTMDHHTSREFSYAINTFCRYCWRSADGRSDRRRSKSSLATCSA